MRRLLSRRCDSVRSRSTCLTRPYAWTASRCRLHPHRSRLFVRWATNPGSCLDTWLLRAGVGTGYSGPSHLLRVYVQQLRRKLRDDPAQPLYITTEPGLGYRWTDE